MEETPIIDLTKSGNYKEVQKRYEELKKQKKVVATSGFFDPLHYGHIDLFKKSKNLGDYLIVILNNDMQTIKKKGFVFMPHEEKAKIIAELSSVDEVFISIDEEIPVINSLDFIKPHIFAKGGDRYTHEIPETPICREHGIQIIDGVGEKVQSSSELINKARDFREN